MSGTETADSFSAQPLPSKIIAKISGKSFVPNDVIGLEDLSYLKVLHYGFDDETHEGELIVNKAIAEEVLDIFRELYEKRFPIEKIILIDEFDADDDKSMAANNSSAFCFRRLTGETGLSEHAYGFAVDINPLYNPYVRRWEDESLLILPPSGAIYIERNPNIKGTICKGNDCYNAFVSRGWEWGGEWSDIDDNHHFQKYPRKK